MIMVRDHDRKPFLPGIAKIKQLITKRVDFVTEQYIKQNNLTTNTKHTIEITLDDLFDDEVTLNLLCEITGGHVREIMFLIQASVTRIRTFPITKSSLHKAIAISRNTYENQVDHQDWQKLVDIYNRKKIINEDDYRQLLFTRCVLEYREPDTLKVWHAVHPLIKEIWQKFEDYVKEDPEKLLRNCHPKKYPDCNCQLLAQKLLLKEPPKRLSQIYREFQNSGVKIPDQTLRSHWKKSVSPYFNKF